MNRFIIAICWIFLSTNISAQDIMGKVMDTNGAVLIGANVYFQGTTTASTTNESGLFFISADGIEKPILITSYVGYEADTFDMTGHDYIEFKLKDAAMLEEVVVSGEQDGTFISSINPIKSEAITTTEIQRSACCDLAGCFETEASVESRTTNVITNSRELRILGLSGVYNQVLLDGIPLVNGLNYTYGISSIPGTLVNTIFVSKGANSVLQGFESISGQTNVLTKDPEKADKLFVNLYMNHFLERQQNISYGFKKGKWNNYTAFHGVQPARKIDRDKDNFLDVPQLRRYELFNKSSFGNDTQEGWSASYLFRLLNEQRVGGQTTFDPKKDQGSSVYYGQTVNYTQPEVWGKTTYRFNNNSKITFFGGASYHNQTSYFGTTKYDASQTNIYSSLQHDLEYAKDHSLKYGLSFRLLDIDENIAFTDELNPKTFAGEYIKRERIPGLFFENTFRFLEDKLTWIVGGRVDHHNTFGIQFTPRSLVKYDFNENSTLRVSGGLGWRTANIFSEHLGLLVSSRDIIFEEHLNPEQAVNFGINYTQKYSNDIVSGYFSADFYRTDFHNQIFPDFHTSSTKAFISNFEDKSFSNGFQVEFNAKVSNKLDMKIAYNYLDVSREETPGELETLPFITPHKFLFTAGFKPDSKKWHWDGSLHWFGARKLPDTSLNPVEFQRPDYSDSYLTVNTQFTYSFEKIELYAGCENIFDFRQLQPILSWEDPFGPYFDTSSVWGPTRGREFYVGARYSIE